MQLSDIKTKLTSRANRRDLTADTALQQTFIDQAVMRIQRELRVPAMEKSVNVTINSSYAGLVIPSDLLEEKSIVPAATDQELDKGGLTECLRLARNTGSPAKYCRQGGVWVLGPAPVSGDVIRIDYWAEMSPLVNPTDENVISIIAWDLILEGALFECWKHFKDAERRDEANTSFQMILDDLQAQADQDELNGAAEVLPTYEFPDDIEGL